jgi:hypothetical protein
MILSSSGETIAAKIHLTANLSLAAATNPWITHATNGDMGHGLVRLGDDLCLADGLLSEKSSKDAHGAYWANHWLPWQKLNDIVILGHKH